MLITDQHPKNKSIMVSVLGAPNVGKSSLINYLMGMDLSIVTHKAQTTRNKFHCVFTVDYTEIILVDTPGLHKSGSELNKRLNEQAREGIDGADVNLLLIDLNREVLVQFKEFKENLRREVGELWVVFTKADKILDLDKLPLNEIVHLAKEILPSISKYFVVDVIEGNGVHQLTGAICDAAKSGPHHYLDGRVSNKNMRFFVCEYVRQQIFELLNEELPYEIAVVIEEYKDLDPEDNPNNNIIASINATILVNRPSQRGIVVGKGGTMIREIGTRARAKVEELLGGQVALKLHAKVSPNWFKNNFVLEQIGLPRATDSARVWHARAEG